MTLVDLCVDTSAEYIRDIHKSSSLIGHHKPKLSQGFSNSEETVIQIHIRTINSDDITVFSGYHLTVSHMILRDCAIIVFLES